MFPIGTNRLLSDRFKKNAVFVPKYSETGQFSVQLIVLRLYF